MECTAFDFAYHSSAFWASSGEGVHRFVQEASFSRGCPEGRGVVCEVESGALHHAPRVQPDGSARPGALPEDRLASLQEVPPCPGRPENNGFRRRRPCGPESLEGSL